MTDIHPLCHHPHKNDRSEDLRPWGYQIDCFWIGDYRYSSSLLSSTQKRQIWRPQALKLSDRLFMDKRWQIFMLPCHHPPKYNRSEDLRPWGHQIGRFWIGDDKYSSSLLSSTQKRQIWWPQALRSSDPWFLGKRWQIFIVIVIIHARTTDLKTSGPEVVRSVVFE